MTNAIVGKVYQSIIEAVIESSKNDFEENGVDRQTLQQMQELWQKRLTDGQRAHFPWDPQPPPSDPSPVQAPESASATPRPSAQLKQEEPPAQATPQPPQQQTPAPQGNGQPAQAQQADGIKQESSYDNNTPAFLNLPQGSGYPQPQYAQARAAQLIQNRFGPQGQGSIAALQAAGQTAGTNQPRTNGTAHPGQPASQAPATKTEIKEEQDAGSLGVSQTDGAGEMNEEWEAVRGKQRALSEAEIANADRLIRNQVDAMMVKMEAGGPLVPLEKRRQTHRRQRAGVRQAQQKPSAKMPVSQGEPSVPQYDGNNDDDDDDVDDEDAINSDLDDPEDNINDGIEGSMDGDLILCLYDKVQRVKNKWKCTLKDGVVSVGGKDYVFHKANGEFEW